MIVPAAAILAGPSAAIASGGRAVVAVKTVVVGAPGNPSVGIVPFTDAIYQSCDGAPDLGLSSPSAASTTATGSASSR